MTCRVPDRWAAACSAVALLALLVVAVHVAIAAIVGDGMPYAGGAAVVLGLGAVVASTLGGRAVRVAVATGVLGLLVLRAVAGVRPDLLLASHGPVAPPDLVALVLLMLGASLLLAAAARCPAGKGDGPQPVGTAAG